jgi:hypothetical protein
VEREITEKLLLVTYVKKVALAVFPVPSSCGGMENSERYFVLPFVEMYRRISVPSYFADVFQVP